MITMRIMTRLMLMVVCLFVMSAVLQTPVCAAEQVGFLNDAIKIMMRSGKGSDYRIIAMPTLGQKVTVLEEADGWVKIRTDAGTEGWVLSRFVGYDVPYRIRFDALHKEYKEISETRAAVEKANSRLTNENKEMAKRLNTGMGEMTAQIEKLTNENRFLRDEVSNRLIKWFLTGAGVLFLGFLIGYLTKRERRRSYLL